MNKYLLIRKLLADSVTELLKTKKIENITVNEIVEKCELSRTTFYRYFEDKYALINWIFSQYMDELTFRYQHSSCYKQLMFDLTSFIRSKREMFIKMFEFRGQNSFSDYFVERTIQYTEDHLRAIKNVRTLSDEDQYMVHFNSCGVYSILCEWLENGCEETPEVMSQIIIDSMPQKIKELFSAYYHEDWPKETD